MLSPPFRARIDSSPQCRRFEEVFTEYTLFPFLTSDAETLVQHLHLRFSALKRITVQSTTAGGFPLPFP